MGGASRTLPGFDLVVATVDRVEPLDRLLDSLESQSHRRFRVLLVDQNEDDRLEPVVGRHSGLGVLRLHSARGLSRARNAALADLSADIVAFPDDDCVYASDLLERVARRFTAQQGLDGLTGRAAGLDGSTAPNWKTDSAALDRENLWNRAISFTIFLRRDDRRAGRSLRRATRTRLGDALALRRGDRLPGTGNLWRRAGRVRPRADRRSRRDATVTRPASRAGAS